MQIKNPQKKKKSDFLSERDRGKNKPFHHLAISHSAHRACVALKRKTSTSS